MTQAGWIVLGCQQAFGAEIWAARDLIDSITSLLRDRVHTLVWDRAVTGSHVPDLMATRGILVINKQVARPKEPAGERRMRDFEAIRRHNSHEFLPLGVCVYPTGRPGGLEVVHSNFYRYDLFREGGCTHDLWVDDGALYDVVQGWSGRRVKGAHVVAEGVERVPGEHGMTVLTNWVMPCQRTAAGAHRFSTTWDPRPGKTMARPDPSGPCGTCGRCPAPTGKPSPALTTCATTPRVTTAG